MKVKYIGEKSDWLSFIKNKVYEASRMEHGYLRVVDETGEDYLYNPDSFEALDDEEYEELMKRPEYKPHKCPICGKTEFSMKDSGERCKVCGWFDYPGWNKAPEGVFKERYERNK